MAAATHASPRLDDDPGEGPIVIRHVSGAYGIFTMFGRRSIVLDGEVWLTAAHFIQARKVSDTDLARTVRQAPCPSAAVNAVRYARVRDDWPQTRTGLIHRAVRAKIIQHPRLAAALRATGQRQLLVTDTESGGNEVGETLMQLRDELAKPIPPAVQRAETLIPASIRSWRWVLFGDSVLVGIRVPSPTMPAVNAFHLLRTADSAVPALSGRPDLAEWRFPSGAVLWHHPDGPPPATCAALQQIAPTSEVTHVYWPDATPISPSAR